jgi:hypothetical protein
VSAQVTVPIGCFMDRRSWIVSVFGKSAPSDSSSSARITVSASITFARSSSRMLRVP